VGCVLYTAKPLPTTYGDGVPDDFDACPDVAGVPENNGCPMVELVTDSDGDGVADSVDQCPNSIVTPTVLVGSCDTGVSNGVEESGYTLADRVTSALNASAQVARNHGDFVSAMSAYLNGLVVSSMITSAEKDAIMSCVATADATQFGAVFRAQQKAKAQKAK